jgi:HK97 family phage prohead protease
VRSPATNGGVQGLAPITLMRMGISTGLKRQAFEGLYYDRNAEPRVVLSFPEKVTPDEAEDWRELWNDTHQGLPGAHGTAVTGLGATVKTIPVSLADAQFVEAIRATADQLGFVYGMPKVFMNTVDRPTMTDNDWRYFITFGLSWIAVAIDQAFSADIHIFPTGSNLRAETITDALIKPDILTRYQAYVAARQAGWLTANEIRALENYPPVTGGDVLQVTPVGGAVDNTGHQGQQTPEKALELLIAEFKDAGADERHIIERMIERAAAGRHRARRRRKPIGSPMSRLGYAVLDSKFELKELDDTGRIKGYAAVFGNEDKGGDIIEPGAFTKTIQETGGQVPILWQHDRYEPIGVSTSLEQDRKGLLIDGQLNMDVQRAREARSLLNQKALQGLSIGYQTVKHAYDGPVGV